MKNEAFDLINKTRIKKGLKVVELCRLAGVSMQSWITIKKNDTYTIQNLSKFCRALGIDEMTIKFKNYGNRQIKKKTI